MSVMKFKIEIVISFLSMGFTLGVLYFMYSSLAELSWIRRDCNELHSKSIGALKEIKEISLSGNSFMEVEDNSEVEKLQKNKLKDQDRITKLNRLLTKMKNQLVNI